MRVVEVAVGVVVRGELEEVDTGRGDRRDAGIQVDAGLIARAIYVERGTMDATTSCRLVEKADDRAPYFSIVLVAGWAGRS